MALRLGNSDIFRRVVTVFWHASQRGVHHAILQPRVQLVVQEVPRGAAVHQHRHLVDIGLKGPPVGHGREAAPTLALSVIFSSVVLL